MNIVLEIPPEHTADVGAWNDGCSTLVLLLGCLLRQGRGRRRTSTGPEDA